MTSANYIQSDFFRNTKVLGVRTSTWLWGKHNSTHKQTCRRPPRKLAGEEDGEMRGEGIVDAGECLLLKNRWGKVKRQREHNEPSVLLRLIYPHFPWAFLSLRYFTFLELFSKLLAVYENPSFLSRPTSNLLLALVCLLPGLPREISSFSAVL